MPKNWVRIGPETMLEVRALNPGQPTPKAMPSSVNATTNAVTEVAKAITSAPENWATVPQMTTARAPAGRSGPPRAR